MKRTTLFACLALLISFSANAQNSQISGKVTYDDTLTPHQEIKNTLLILHNINGVAIDSTITDQNGDYKFNNLTNGTYHIQTICKILWSGGSATDVMTVAGYFTGKYILTGLRLKAADVDASGYINSLDAYYIIKRMVFMITSFPAGEWIFEEDLITVNGNNVVYNYKGTCVGDVDGSHIVP